MIIVLILLAGLCFILALEAWGERRRADFWRGAYDRQHEMHMRHLREESELTKRQSDQLQVYSYRLRWEPRSWN